MKADSSINQRGWQGAATKFSSKCRQPWTVSMADKIYN